MLYHLGNNPDHTYIYDAAVKHPGIVVLHEFNLHHLLADVTIRRDDWKGYMREVERSGGPAALEFAQRVRALEVGPIRGLICISIPYSRYWITTNA